MSNKLVLSKLSHTWFFDIDGTLVKHNGYKIDGHDTLLAGVKEFFDTKISNDDFVVLTTSRTLEFKKITEDFLLKNGIRYNQIIFGLPYGERILVNDKKPSGLEVSKSINLNRDEFNIDFDIDEKI